MNPVPDAPVPGGPREDQSSSLVLGCGLVTSALTLFGVYLLNANTSDFHIMGWYADYVIPVGAIIVGVAAACGYGLASWFSGIKIERRLLWMILALQLTAYLGAQYIEFHGRHLVYRASGKPVHFLEYWDQSARGLAWKQQNGEMGAPLGAWGYGVRALEVLGFGFGGLVVPLLLRKSPYCESCQRYMRTRQMAFVPGSVKVKKVKKSDVAGSAAYQAEQQEALDGGKRTVERLQQFATSSQVKEFREMLADLKQSKRQTLNLPGRFSVQLVHCRRCYEGLLVSKLLVGQGQHVKQIEFSRAALPAEFVRSICG